MTAISGGNAAPAAHSGKLKKELRLFDVYAICTGAMFSSGFFLLPGLAAAQAGPSVSLAYLLAGILMLPAMFSMAELATAMPRAGGDYYFLDRALGPMVGTVGGTGTYLALTLKSAFALIGMGAYLALFIDVPIRPVAIGLTVLFMVFNIIGAKETTNLQRILIVILIGVMALFMVQGIGFVAQQGIPTTVETQFRPYLPFGFEGLIGTVGFVFVSYAGLTKIASVSEEVVNPSRNIPLGMMLSIFSTTIIYVVGVAVMTAALDPNEFRAVLTPVAAAAGEVITIVPPNVGALLVAVAAIAAFASTGNAGILAASRYPLAMGRDRLLPSLFASVSKKKRTPVFSIIVTGGLMMGAILLLNEEGIAKLASAFQLIIFMLVNASVIVMRESRIDFYDPSAPSPFYPYMQLFGVAASIFLLSFIGASALLLSLGLALLAFLWFQFYARGKVSRHGAIYHWFERLGRSRYAGLEAELREILKEKGLRDEDPYDEVITRATVLDIHGTVDFEELAERAIQHIAQHYPMVPPENAQDFARSLRSNYVFEEQGVALPNLRLAEVDHTELVMVRLRKPLTIIYDGDEADENKLSARMIGLFFLVSPEDNPGQHLRLLTQISRHVEEPDFAVDWVGALDEQELKEILLRSDRLLTLWLDEHHRTREFIGRPISEIQLPDSVLIALIQRDGDVLVPRGRAILEEGDRITIIGDEEDINDLFHQYVGEQTTEGG